MAAKSGSQKVRAALEAELPGEKRPGYVKHGSEQHAAMLGLRRAGEADTLEVNGWTLADITVYGPAARPEFLEQVLRQKVSTLASEVPVPQSDDPQAPHYAPPLWVPPEGEASGIV